jgi:hypothetical protein
VVVVKQSFEIPHEGNELMRAARQKIDEDIGELKKQNPVPEDETQRIISHIYPSPGNTLQNIHPRP